jgi:hypothetical protein
VWPLRKSTAGQVVPLGRFLATDGITAQTGLTITASDIRIMKGGATTFVAKNSGGATHAENGYYTATLNATDTNTLGPTIVNTFVSGVLYTERLCCVYEPDYYDSVFGAVLTIAAATSTSVTLPAPWNTGLAVGREIYDLTGNQSRHLLAHQGSGVYTVASWTAPSVGTPFALGSLMPPSTTSAGLARVDLASIGLASANLDTQLAAISSKTTNLPASFPTNFGSLAITAGGLVGINVAQAGLTVRDLTNVMNASLTVGDAFVAAIALAAGQGSVVSAGNGATYTVATPVGTTVAARTLNSITNPTVKT